MERRLAAILVADIVGYTRLMGTDEAGTLRRLTELRQEILEPLIAEHHGRIVKLTGDGLLVEFASVVDTVACALVWQESVAQHEAGGDADSRLQFRIGINLGDVIVEGEDIFGDGVNIAARLEGVAEPGGICLSADVYRQVRGKIETAFEDIGQKDLKNVTEAVRVYRIAANQSGVPATSPENDTLALPDKPSIAVLPFTNMSGEADQEYFADGITEDIITTLSKIPGLLVVARNSTYVYKGRSVDVKQVGAEQGVHFVLEGSTRMSGDRIRITAQLIDAATGHHLWADRYDRKVDDLFALQDEISIRIVTELQIELLEGEMARLSGSGTNEIEAWREQVRAVACTHVVTKESYNQARRYAERATEIDPDYASPLATLGWVHWLEGRLGWVDPRNVSITKAQEYAERALELDPQNPEAHGVLGVVHMIEGRHDDSIARLVTGLDLSPSHANLTAYLSVTRTWNGESELGINLAEKAMRLSPIYPAWYSGAHGFALRRAGRYAEATRALKVYGKRQQGAGHVDLAIIYVETDQIETARHEVEEILRYQPEFTIGKWAETQMYRDPTHLEHDISALRKLDLPE